MLLKPARPAPRSVRRTQPRRGPLLAFFAGAGVPGGGAPSSAGSCRVSRGRRGCWPPPRRCREQKPVVLVSPARLAANKDAIDLPGDLQAMIESPIFSRADGYLKSRLVDHRLARQDRPVDGGDRDARAGSADRQARAALAQAQSSLKELEADIELSQGQPRTGPGHLGALAQSPAKRAWCRGRMPIRKQADFAVKEAQLRRPKPVSPPRRTRSAPARPIWPAGGAEGFARVTAPFDGVVTARNVDIGTLINRTGQQGAVPRGADRSAAHFRERAADLCGADPGRPDRRVAGPGTARQGLSARKSPASPMPWTPIPAPCW